MEERERRREEALARKERQKRETEEEARALEAREGPEEAKGVEVQEPKLMSDLVGKSIEAEEGEEDGEEPVTKVQQKEDSLVRRPSSDEEDTGTGRGQR